MVAAVNFCQDQFKETTILECPDMLANIPNIVTHKENDQMVEETTSAEVKLWLML